MAVLAPLRVGEIAPDPVTFGVSYVVPKRVPAQPEQPRVARFDLP